MITPLDADHDKAQTLWTGAIDKRAALIARCADATDGPAPALDRVYVIFGGDEGPDRVRAYGETTFAGPARMKARQDPEFVFRPNQNINPPRPMAAPTVGVRTGDAVPTHPTLTQMLVAAHAADLTDQARQAALARAARTSERHPGRLRTSTARLLVGLARRLDHRLAPIPAPAPISGSR